MQIETVYAGPTESIAEAIVRWYQRHPSAVVQEVEIIDDKTAMIQFIGKR